MKKLYRSRKNKKIFGLCGGLGTYFGIDPAFIRLILLFICIFTAVFPVLIVYSIASLIVPLEPLHRPAKKIHTLYRSKKNKVIAGVCAGVAEFFKIDPTIIRLGFVFFMIATGFFPMLVTYLVACVIIPLKSG